MDGSKDAAGLQPGAATSVEYPQRARFDLRGLVTVAVQDEIAAPLQAVHHLAPPGELRRVRPAEPRDHALEQVVVRYALCREVSEMFAACHPGPGTIPG